MSALFAALKPILEALFHELFAIFTKPDVVLPDPVPVLDSMVDTSSDRLLDSYGGLLGAAD